MDRRDHEDDPNTILQDSMAKIADLQARPEKVEAQIRDVANAIKRQLDGADSGANREAVTTALYRCGTALPIKAPMYAVLVALLPTMATGSAAVARDMTKRLVELVVTDFTTSMREGRAATARRALRFLVCLGITRVVKLDGVAEYVHLLLDAALFELTTANRSEFGVHARGEFLAEIALSALPWLGYPLVDRGSEELERIVQTFGEVADVWRASLWRCVAPASDRRCTEAFGELIDAIFELKDDGWKVDDSVIPVPYSMFEKEIAEAPELTVPTITVPGHSKKMRYTPPRYRLMLINPRIEKREVILLTNDAQGEGDKMNEGDDMTVKEENGETDNDKGSDKPSGPAPIAANTMDISTQNESPNGPGANDNSTGNDDTRPKGESEKKGTAMQPVVKEKNESERPLSVNYVLRSYVTDVVDNFTSRHMMAAERLLNLPMLKDVNDEVVEGLFTQMCALPHPSFSPVYYGTLFADLCRVKDSRLPAKLLVAVKTMFQHADELDPEIFDRLTDWFAFHLSNFGYKWNWQEWAVYADNEMVERFPFRALFCKDVIARCVRLSYFDRMKSMLPEEMKVFLPPQTNNGNRDRFDDDINGALLKIVTGKGRQSWEIVQTRLAELVPEKTSEEPEKQAQLEAQVNLARLSALIKAILQAGCRTLSHFDIVVERYMDLLRMQSLKGGAPARKVITTEVSCFWRDVHIRRLYVLDKLAQYNVIDHMSILDSCLSSEKPDDALGMEPMTDAELTVRLSQSSYWEMIRLVMARARAREEGSRNELFLASQAAASANEGDEDAERRLERAKTASEESKNEVRNLLLEALKRLFSMSGRLLDLVESEMDTEMGERGQDDKHRLPGFHAKPIWFWRCMGMIRELARMHPQHLSQITNDLDTHTKELREKHQVLWESFEIVKEIEFCSMTAQVM